MGNDNGSSVLSRSGDLGDPDGDWAVAGGAAAGLVRAAPPAAAGPAGRGGSSVWPSAGFSGGRFWVLRDEMDEESATSEVSDGEGGDAGESPAGSPRASPSQVTLGDFISRAEELGGSLSSRRRAAFAPGGKGSRFSAASAPRFRRLGESPGSSGGQRRGGDWVSAGERRSAGAVASSPSPAAVSGEGMGTLARPRSVERAPVAVVGLELGCGPSEVSHPLLLLGPLVDPGPIGPVGLVRWALSPGPRVLASSDAARRGRFKWMWLPRGCLDPSLGFLASSQEVWWRSGPSRSLLRIPDPPLLSRSFAEVVAMARRGDEGRGKRRLEGYGEDGGRQDDGRWYQQDGPQGYQGFQGGFQDQRYPEQRYPEPQQRDNWGPPPPWWLEEQKRKKKAEAAKNRGQGQGQGQGSRAGGAEGASSGAGGSGGQQGKAKAQSSGAAPAPKPKGKGKPGDGPTLLSSGECFKCGRGGHF
jgi:hypothetical protein